jgi:hypothetical protein
MGYDIIWGVARAILAALGGVLVTKGYAEAGMVETIIGAIGVLSAAGWSIIAKMMAAK